MSLDITATPPDYSSVHGDLIYTVAYTDHTSDPVTYPNYKFVGDVYIGAVLVARLKKVPDPINKVGIFNVGQIVRNYMAVMFNPATEVLLSQVMGDTEFNISVTMVFGEEYSYTTFTGITADTPRVFFNNYNGRLIGEPSSITASLIDKVLSDRPLSSPVKCNSRLNLLPYFPSTDAAFNVEIKSYDWSNSVVQTISTTVTPDDAYQLHIFNLSKEALNYPMTNFITDEIKYYTAEFNSNGIIYRFNLDCECRFDVFTLHFLNKYGGFESKDFTKVSRKTIAIEKKDFGKLPYTVDSSGAVTYKNVNNVYNDSRSVYSSQFKEKMSLNSDFLSDAEYRWLQQLVISPMVYMEEGGYFFPVVISETSYEPKKYINDELTNLTINIEFGEQLNAQFR